VRSKTWLKEMKKISAGNMVKCVEFVIGKSIEDWIYEKKMQARMPKKRKEITCMHVLKHRD
jgi:hypothetical protein